MEQSTNGTYRGDDPGQVHPARGDGGVAIGAVQEHALTTRDIRVGGQIQCRVDDDRVLLDIRVVECAVEHVVAQQRGDTDGVGLVGRRCVGPVQELANGRVVGRQERDVLGQRQLSQEGRLRPEDGWLVYILCVSYAVSLSLCLSRSLHLETSSPSRRELTK